MVDDLTMTWLVVIAVLVVFGSVLFWLMELVPKARLMRCPEAGSVVFVDVQSKPGSGDNVSEVKVGQCELWPGKKDCARGCLARYEDTAPGFRINLDALRPFEPR